MTSSTIPYSSLERFSIPESAKRALSTRGLPDDLRLPGWVGPTLFTSAIGEGLLREFSDYFPARARTLERVFVLGTICETMGAPIGAPYAAFILTAPDGRVELVDLAGDGTRRIVNSSLEQFLDSLTLLMSRWTAVSGSGAAAADAVVRLREEMVRLDPAAWEAADHYWPTWFEELEDQTT
jgi:hypothetical protein